MDRESRLRVGIVGAGLRGRLFAQSLESEPDVEVVGFADPVAVSDAHPVFQDVAALCDEAEPDAVILATPDHLHAEAAEVVCERGLPLMLEKPVATTREDAERIRRASTAGGSRVMVAFENRWNPPFMQMRRLLDDGRFGRPVHQQAALSNTTFVPTRMLRWAEHSSPVWFLMPHTIDLVMWMAGSPVASVTATGSQGILRQAGVDTWDVVHATLLFEDGTSAALTSSWVLPESAPSIVDFTYELVGTEGAARTDIGREGLQTFGRRHDTVGLLDTPQGGVVTAAPAWMVRSFVHCVRTGERFPTTLEDGLAVNEVLFAIERSLASGNREDVQHAHTN